MSGLVMWVVYDHPRDFPNSYVARKWELRRPTPDHIVSGELDALRDLLALRGLTPIPRDESDDAVIVETWI